MAPTASGSQSSSQSCPSLLDCCCDLQTRKNISCFLKLKCLAFVLLALVVGAGSVLLVLRFTVTPQIKAYIEDARLNSFSSADTRASFSAYNISISVALTVRNPNGAMPIKYTKPLIATFLFHERRLYNVTVADEGHKHKRLKREVHLLHTGGEALCPLDPEAVEELKKQNATGMVKVEMRLTGRITLGIGNSRGLELSCPLTLQSPSPAPGPDPDVVVFQEVDCKPDTPKKIVF